MSKCINLGKFNANYKYFLLSIICLCVKDIAFGSSNVYIFEHLRIIDNSKSFLIHEIFCYLFTILISFIFYKIEQNSIDNNNNINDEPKTINLIGKASNKTLELIHNEEELITYSIGKFLFIIFLWIFEEELLSYYGEIMMLLDFWMLELIIISFFMIRILNIKLYKHQKLMLFLIIIPLILKIVTIYTSFKDEKNYCDGSVYKYCHHVNKLKLIYVTFKWLVGIGICIYSILITLRAFVNTKLKWLIDHKYISPMIILIFYGIVGSLFCIIICGIATFFPCGPDEHNDYTIYDYFCKVKYNNNKYLDNFFSYFTNNENFKIETELLTIILGAFSFFFHKYFYIRTIEHLTPVHIIFSFPIYYILNKSYLILINFIKSNQFYIKDMKNAKEILILDYISDGISIILYLIYLEIIEFHCFGYDFNLRRNILERGELDMDNAELSRTIKNSSDFSIEKTLESPSSSRVQSLDNKKVKIETQ